MNDEKLTKWIIYVYTFPNGKRYVGKSKRSLSERQGYLFHGYENCTALWNAIQKYGVDSIEQEILIEDYMTAADASRLEQEFIELYRTNCNRYNTPKYGYNLTDGGEELEFNSVEEASEYFGVRESSISRWASGERHPRNNNYSFKIYPRTTTKRESVM